MHLKRLLLSSLLLFITSLLTFFQRSGSYARGEQRATLGVWGASYARGSGSELRSRFGERARLGELRKIAKLKGGRGKEHSHNWMPLRHLKSLLLPSLLLSLMAFTSFHECPFFMPLWLHLNGSRKWLYLECEIKFLTWKKTLLVFGGHHQVLGM